MTGRRLQFGVAVVDSKIYVVGGRDGLKTLSTVCYDFRFYFVILHSKNISGNVGRVLGSVDKSLELHATYGNAQTWYFSF